MRLFNIPVIPLLLTLAGLVPFVAPAALMWMSGSQPIRTAQAALVLIVYGAIILSFLGGVRWGAEINAQGSGGIPRGGLMYLSVLGSLAGWGLVLWAVLGQLGWPVFAAAAGAHLVHMAWDANGAGMPFWYRRLRLFAGSGAALSLAAAAAAYALR
ncbi:DUF3429 domain-containing protein [Hyphomonas sp.]|uniref:DUF3429 domain-containing protein n=1 Tax=Hyphomonas sp. TaxID=87 RepID=UPI00391D6914